MKADFRIVKRLPTQNEWLYSNLHDKEKEVFIVEKKFLLGYTKMKFKKYRKKNHSCFYNEDAAYLALAEYVTGASNSNVVAEYSFKEGYR